MTTYTHKEMVTLCDEARQQGREQQDAELARFRRVYQVFEDASPPGGQKAFAERCFDAEAKQCEVDQAWGYLFEHGWKLLINQLAVGQVSALSICVRFSRVDQRADGSTIAEAIIALAKKVAKSVETKGA